MIAEFLGAIGGLSHRLVEQGAVLFAQSTLVLAAGLGAGWLFRRRGAALQSLCYRAALSAVVVLTLATLVLPGRPALWQVSLPPLEPVAPPAVQTEPPPARLLVSSDRLGLPLAKRPATLSAADPSPGVPSLNGSTPAVPALYSLLAVTWAAGAGGLLLWLGICRISLERLRRGAVAVPSGPARAALVEECLARRVRSPALLASGSVGTPFLTGLHCPAILLPSGYQEAFSPAFLRAILAHEVTHLERHDCWWHLAGRVCCAVGWVQPLLWVLCRRMEHTAEEICDARVVQGGCSARLYARWLLELAERQAPRPAERAMGVAVAAFRSSVGRRIVRILDGRGQEAVQVPPHTRLLAQAAAASILAVALTSISVPVPASSLTPPSPARAMEAPAPVLAQDAVVLGLLDRDLLAPNPPEASTSVTTSSDVLTRAVALQPPPVRSVQPPAPVPAAPAAGVSPASPTRSELPVPVAMSPPAPGPAAGLPLLAAAATNTGRISGRVIREDGTPAEGVLVEAHRSNASARDLPGSPSSRRATTGADGSYRIEGLVIPAHYYVVVREDPTGTMTYENPIQVDLRRSTSTRAADLVLMPWSIVEGTVLDLETGEPIAGVDLVAKVRRTVGGMGQFSFGKTDAQGRYRLRLWAGSVEVTLFGPRPAGSSPRVRLLPETTVRLELGRGETKAVRHTVDRAAVQPAPAPGS